MKSFETFEHLSRMTPSFMITMTHSLSLSVSLISVNSIEILEESAPEGKLLQSLGSRMV